MQGMPRVLKLPTLLELAAYMGYKAVYVRPFGLCPFVSSLDLA